MQNTVQQIITYWRRSAREDAAVADVLFEKKKYAHALFFCHLAIEKMLKGLVVATTNEPAPYTHELVRLALLARLPITKKQRTILEDMTVFNIAGRYADAKFAFHTTHNRRPIARRYLNHMHDLLLWIEKHFQNE